MDEMASNPPSRTSRALSLSLQAAVVIAVFAVAGCAPLYPLGMSKQEWLRLTPEQQHEARMKQAELNRARNQRRAQEAAERRQRIAAQEARERRRIAALYEAARYGDILECVIDGGIADFHPGWRPFAPVAFTLVPSESKRISFRGDKRRSGSFWASYGSDGHSLTICQHKPFGRPGRTCTTVRAGSRAFTRGIAFDLAVRDVFKGAELVCAYRPGYDTPRYVYREYDVYIWRTLHRHHRPNRRYPYARYARERDYDRYVRRRDHRGDRPRFDRRDDGRPVERDGRYRDRRGERRDDARREERVRERERYRPGDKMREHLRDAIRRRESPPEPAPSRVTVAPPPDQPPPTRLRRPPGRRHVVPIEKEPERPARRRVKPDAPPAPPPAAKRDHGRERIMRERGRDRGRPPPGRPAAVDKPPPVKAAKKSSPEEAIKAAEEKEEEKRRSKRDNLRRHLERR